MDKRTCIKSVIAGIISIILFSLALYEEPALALLASGVIFIPQIALYLFFSYYLFNPSNKSFFVLPLIGAVATILTYPIMIIIGVVINSISKGFVVGGYNEGLGMLIFAAVMFSWIPIIIFAGSGLILAAIANSSKKKPKKKRLNILKIFEWGYVIFYSFIWMLLIFVLRFLWI